MSSWAEGNDRVKASSPQDKEQIEEKIRLIENALRFFANDEDLHQDLKLPIVQAAVNHWIGKNRLAPEKATRLFENNRSVLSVIQKIQKLQHVCREIGQMPLVPFDFLLNRKTLLDNWIIEKYFGKEFIRGEVVSTGRSAADPSLTSIERANRKKQKELDNANFPRVDSLSDVTTARRMSKYGTSNQKNSTFSNMALVSSLLCIITAILFFLFTRP